MSPLSVTLDLLLNDAVDRSLLSVVRESVERELREANERGYEAGFRDAKNAAAIAIEKLRIEDDE